jgi:hypothetical protein
VPALLFGTLDNSEHLAALLSYSTYHQVQPYPLDLLPVAFVAVLTAPARASGSSVVVLTSFTAAPGDHVRVGTRCPLVGPPPGEQDLAALSQS